MALELPLAGCAVALAVPHAPSLASLRFRVVRHCLLVGLASSSALKRNKHADMGGGTSGETSRILDPPYTVPVCAVSVKFHITVCAVAKRYGFGGARCKKIYICSKGAR